MYSWEALPETAASDHSRKLFACFCGNAEQLGDDGDGQRERVVVYEVHLTLSCTASSNPSEIAWTWAQPLYEARR